MTPDREPIDVRLRLDVREVLLYALLPAAITLGGSLRLLPHVLTGGLIDLHSHVYWGVSEYGVDADSVVLPGGVTTTVDAGPTERCVPRSSTTARRSSA